MNQVKNKVKSNVKIKETILYANNVNSVFRQSYVSLDLETTGLDPKRDKIIEIGAVKVIDGIESDTYVTFVNPGTSLPEKVTELTGIKEEDLQEAPYIEDCIRELLDFIGELPLMGHSVLFDYSFTRRAAVNAGLCFEKEGVDTLLIARKYLPELESRNLGFLCRHFKIEHDEHRALGDARATHELYQLLCEKFYMCGDANIAEDKAGKEEKAEKIEEKAEKIEQKAEKTEEKAERKAEKVETKTERQAEFLPRKLVYQVKKESPITKHQKERLYELIEQHKLIVDYQVEHLSRNEASRYIDKILSKYGR